MTRQMDSRKAADQGALLSLLVPRVLIRRAQTRMSDTRSSGNPYRPSFFPLPPDNKRLSLLSSYLTRRPKCKERIVSPSTDLLNSTSPKTRRRSSSLSSSKCALSASHLYESFEHTAYAHSSSCSTAFDLPLPNLRPSSKPGHPLRKATPSRTPPLRSRSPSPTRKKVETDQPQLQLEVRFRPGLSDSFEGLHQVWPSQAARGLSPSLFRTKVDVINCGGYRRRARLARYATSVSSSARAASWRARE